MSVRARNTLDLNFSGDKVKMSISGQSPEFRYFVVLGTLHSLGFQPGTHKAHSPHSAWVGTETEPHMDSSIMVIWLPIQVLS